MLTIAGAGPAGSACAYYLANSAFEVTLYDKEKFPREKPCAGGLFNPEAYIKEFPWLEKFINQNTTSIYKVEFRCDNVKAEFQSDKPLLATTTRKEFDSFILKQAKKQGAAFIQSKLNRADITATGAKHFTYKHKGICFVAEAKTKSKPEPKAIIHYFFNHIKGYAWLFPKKHSVNIGLGTYLPCRNAKDAFFRFIDKLKEESLLQKNIAPKPNAALIPFSPRKLYDKNTVFIGDSAGLVAPKTGEGIFFAMLSGKLLADAIWRWKELSKRAKKEYAIQCKKKILPMLKPIPFADYSITWKLAKAIIRRKIKKHQGLLAKEFFRLTAENRSPF